MPSEHTYIWFDRSIRLLIWSLISVLCGACGSESKELGALWSLLLEQETHKTRGVMLQLYKSGDRETALEMLREDADMNEKLLGPHHPYVASYLDNTGIILLELGEFRIARDYLERAKKNRQEALGTGHPWFGVSLANLGLLLYHSGDLQEARRHLTQAFEILQHFQEDHAEHFVISLNRLGLLFHDLGNFEKSFDYYEQALATLKARFGDEHLLTIEIYHNVTALLIDAENWQEAEAYGKKALELCEFSFGRNNAHTARSLHNLGVVLYRTGRLQEARGHLERAFSIRERILPGDHVHIGFTLNSLADVLTRRGDHEAARDSYERALDIFEKSFGEKHATVASTLHNLGSHHLAIQEIDRAIELKQRAMALEESTLADSLLMGSEIEKRFFLETLTDTAHEVVTLHTQMAPDDSLAARLALETVLRRKGRALTATAESLRRIRASVTPKNRELLVELATLREEKSFLLWNISTETAGADNEEFYDETKKAAQRARILRLEEEIDDIATRLMSSVDVLDERMTPIDLELVQASLPTKTALVEFFVYGPPSLTESHSSHRTGKSRYVAYVLDAVGEVRHVDLGAIEIVDRAIQSLRQSLASRRRDVRRRAREVDALTLERIRPLLREGVDNLVVSPDGMLNLVPLAALVDEDGRYLIERYGLSYVASGSDLLRTVTFPSREPPLLLGDADFDHYPGKERLTGVSREGEDLRSRFMDSLELGPLPGTAEEIVAVRDLLGVSRERVLVGAAASESAVKRIRRPRILHLATHGFFLPDRDHEPGGPVDALTQASLLAEEPLLRSGLALSGFNRRQLARDADDGVLTALELSNLDLWGTEVVVLSACETGVGDIRTGEGVFGLRRALVLSGARTQVMSLWQVADRATTDLMVSWYAQLLEGRGRADALRQAQIRASRGQRLPITEVRLRGAEFLSSTAREAPDPRVVGTRHPFYWAGFIVSGEAGPYRADRVVD